MSALVVFARERLPVAVFVPVIAGLGALAWWAAEPAARPSARLALAVTSSALFVIRYRLWDDLADRVADRRRYPRRASVTVDAAPLARARHGLLIAHLALFAGAGNVAAITALLGLEGLFVLAYAVRARLPHAVWRYPVLLAKYPLFVVVTALAVAPVDAVRLAGAALVAYAAAWAYEALHDPRPQGALS